MLIVEAHGKTLQSLEFLLVPSSENWRKTGLVSPPRVSFHVVQPC